MTSTTAFHLICGPVGAGKTTYSLRLADELRGMRFSIDDWMTTLFGADRPDPLRFDWMMERIARCEAQIGRLAIRCAALGVAPVLDLGLTDPAHRARIAGLASEGGFPTRLHWLDAPPEIRWQRVEARNRERGATFALEVTRPMFDFVETLWQPPDESEMAALGGRRITASH